MSDKPLISVIVPVYNVERYLPRCIESILGQTYTNFELILVDDGTPDRSGIICDRYAEKDSRIRVIHKENGGVSTARNAGIDAAKGEWITFVDSDDWVSESYLDVLRTPLKRDAFDMTVGLLEYRNMKTSALKCEDYIVDVDKICEANNFHAIDRMEFIIPFLKLFSKEILNKNNLRFIEGVAMGEDAIFVKQYLSYCKKIYVTGKVIYYYNKLNEFSVTNQKRLLKDREKWDIKHLEAYCKMLYAWNIPTEYKQNIISCKAAALFYIHAGKCVRHLTKEDAIKHLENILPYYEKWVCSDSESYVDRNNTTMEKTATYIQEHNVNAIYDMLKNKRSKLLCDKAKQFAKKVMRPLIEKRRDKLIIFKF